MSSALSHTGERGTGSLNLAKKPQCDILIRGSDSFYGLKAVYALKTFFPASEVFPTFLEIFALKLYFPLLHGILPQITIEASRDTAVTTILSLTFYL